MPAHLASGSSLDGTSARVKQAGTRAVRVKLETVVPAGLIERVLQTIAARTHAGNSGDGKVFTWPVEQVIETRTGERRDSVA